MALDGHRSDPSVAIAGGEPARTGRGRVPRSTTWSPPRRSSRASRARPTQLAVAVDCYRRGMTEPLPLFPTFSYHLYRGKSARVLLAGVPVPRGRGPPGRARWPSATATSMASSGLEPRPTDPAGRQRPGLAVRHLPAPDHRPVHHARRPAVTESRTPTADVRTPMTADDRQPGSTWPTPCPVGKLAIQASAGTGKTYTLADLATRFIAEGRASASELLIVTFTRAATDELRARVRDRLVGRGRAPGVGSPRASGDDALLDPLARAGRRRPAGPAGARRVRVRRGHRHHHPRVRQAGARGPRGLGRCRPRRPSRRRLVRPDRRHLCRRPHRRRRGRLPGRPAAEPRDAARGHHAGRRSARSRPGARSGPARRAPRRTSSSASWWSESAALVALRRRQSGTLSFDDVLTQLRDALRGPGGESAVASLRSRFRVALIDEFQDTDPVQWEIFSTLFDGPDAGTSLVLVGDPKQAIYAFRGADVHTYLRAVDDGSSTTRRSLLTNWRSDDSVLTSLDVLFDGATFGSPDIPFVPVRRGRGQPGPVPARWRTAGPCPPSRCDWPSGTASPGTRTRTIWSPAGSGRAGHLRRPGDRGGPAPRRRPPPRTAVTATVTDRSGPRISPCWSGGTPRRPTSRPPWPSTGSRPWWPGPAACSSPRPPSRCAGSSTPSADRPTPAGCGCIALSWFAGYDGPPRWPHCRSRTWRPCRSSCASGPRCSATHSVADTFARVWTESGVVPRVLGRRRRRPEHDRPRSSGRTVRRRLGRRAQRRGRAALGAGHRAPDARTTPRSTATCPPVASPRRRPPCRS